jgi:putative chitinase
VTPKQLALATGASPQRAEAWLAPLEAAMERFEINTPLRQAAFLAQIGVESGGLRYVLELWGPTPTQRRYEGRKDLGNLQIGDGFRYRGRGLIQITGRSNYDEMGRKMGLDLINKPELLCEPNWAALSATVFWDSRKLNSYADRGEFDSVSDLINRGHLTSAVGDANGYPHRLALYDAAKQVIT